MKKFEGWRTMELQFVATLIAGRAMEKDAETWTSLYAEIVKEIRNRRIAEELFQMKLDAKHGKWIGPTMISGYEEE